MSLGAYVDLIENNFTNLSQLVDSVQNDFISIAHITSKLHDFNNSMHNLIFGLDVASQLCAFPDTAELLARKRRREYEDQLRHEADEQARCNAQEDSMRGGKDEEDVSWSSSSGVNSRGTDLDVPQDEAKGADVVSRQGTRSSRSTTSFPVNTPKPPPKSSIKPHDSLVRGAVMHLPAKLRSDENVTKLETVWDAVNQAGVKGAQMSDVARATAFSTMFTKEALNALVKLNLVVEEQDTDKKSSRRVYKTIEYASAAACEKKDKRVKLSAQPQQSRPTSSKASTSSRQTSTTSRAGVKSTGRR